MDIISRLENELDQIVQDFEKPAAEFAETFANLVERRSWDELEELFGIDGARQIRDSFNKNPTQIVRRLRDAAEACQSRFVEDASKKLTRLNQCNFSKLEPHDLAGWLQNRDRNLLDVAFAYKLIGLIKPAAGRARELRDLVVAYPTSEDADKYLSEACDCYFLGLYSASAVMCRSLLEEALERKLPTGELKIWRGEAESRRQELTLGNLLWKINNHDPLLVTPEFLKLAREVNKIATQAAHTRTLSQLEAKNCLLKTQKALSLLLGTDPKLPEQRFD